MVLDGVVRAAFEHLGDLRPLIIDDAVHEEQNPLLFFVPVNFLDSGVQVIVPSLATLLADAAIEVLTDQSPFLRSISDDQLEDAPVFFSSPCSFHVEWFTFSAGPFLQEANRAVRSHHL